MVLNCRITSVERFTAGQMIVFDSIFRRHSVGEHFPLVMELRVVVMAAVVVVISKHNNDMNNIDVSRVNLSDRL